eukprot:gnl/MRDRNA2_/MRDRNA2_383676_c0_seq1.p1 gnl/MRDRNA2_/MRDRNA2_383676_c0~~gnl/MRDRNA2_/MRDRNA2_383676_c0_seq1.p1  ORF type:complete len:147 (+),score=31.25 gnl/MRDRNA2_/MRDRNA2_383676_c0_seq1:222-662(+)
MGSQSRMDFLFLPTTLLKAVMSCQIGWMHGRKLQFIRDKKKEITIHACTCGFRQHVTRPTKRLQWDYSMMANAMQHGISKAEFLDRLEQVCVDAEDEWEEFNKKCQADAMWDKIAQAIGKVGHEFFSVKPVATSDEYKKQMATKKS